MSGNVSSPTVVITGAGLVCALGSDRERTWERIVRGECGIGPMPSMEQTPLFGGGGEAGQDCNIKGARAIALLRRALDEALHEAGIAGAWPCPPERVSIILGTTLGGMRAAGRYLRSGNLSELRSFTAASILSQATAHLPPTGLATTTCAACASGLSSIALGLTLLRCGACDLVIAGGYDPISEYAWAGFNSLRLVSAGPPRPFSRDRQGMNLGEGYGIVVLERKKDAEQRGVLPKALVAGFGESSDAHHLTQPEPTGEGAARAMQAALTDAGLASSAIDMIAAHATATPSNDAAEFAAYQRVFGGRLKEVPVVAFKSHLGHTLGGAGTVELILSMKAMMERTVLPTATVTGDEVEFPELDLVIDKARHVNIQHTMNMSMGFGGANACVILARPNDDHSTDDHRSARGRTTTPADVLITGVGVLLPGAIGNQAFIDSLRSEQWPTLFDIDESEFAHLINARRARRMSKYVKLMLAATSVALEDAGVMDIAAFASTCGAILGTTHGPSRYSEDFYRQVVEEGMAAANPALFAEGVPNAGSAQLSLMLGLQGGAQTIVGSETAGLDALNLALRRIADGSYERLIVGAAEEHCDLVERAHRNCGQPDLVLSAGAVVVVLESVASAEGRGALPRGLLLDAEDEHQRPPGNSRPAWPISFANRLAGFFSTGGLAELAAALLTPLRAGDNTESDFTVTQRDRLGGRSASKVRVRGLSR